jgi:hypothetical protein
MPKIIGAPGGKGGLRDEKMPSRWLASGLGKWRNLSYTKEQSNGYYLSF